jgi:hypothetical protein
MVQSEPRWLINPIPGKGPEKSVKYALSHGADEPAAAA